MSSIIPLPTRFMASNSTMLRFQRGTILAAFLSEAILLQASPSCVVRVPLASLLQFLALSTQTSAQTIDMYGSRLYTTRF